MPHIATPSPPPTSQPAGRLARLSGEMAPLFVYGSLRFPEVLVALLDRVPSAHPPAQRVGASRRRVTTSTPRSFRPTVPHTVSC